MDLISIDEARAQGSGPTLFLNIAKAHAVSNPALAAEARNRAIIFAKQDGVSVDCKRLRIIREAANDNRPRYRRAA